MNLDKILNNPCNERKGFCASCNNHFMNLRPLIKNVIISKHFIRDLKE